MDLLKKTKKLFIAIIVVILLELTVFNFRYYTTKISALEHKTIELSQENLVFDEYDGKNYKKTYSINLNEEIKGIKINSSQEHDYDEISITPKFKDASNKYTYKVLDEVKYMPRYKNREYIVLNSQKNCLLLDLEMSSSNNFDVSSVEINTWYFEFNLFRVLVLILISSAILYRKEINNYFQKNPKEKKAFYAGFIIIATMLFAYYSFDYHTLYENSAFDPGMVFRDIYTEFTKSIMNGKITLDFPEEFKEKISQLENYHDYSERVNAGNPYLYDAAFYKGNFYCYYGVVPVITVFLPIALFTGIYCYSNLACIIYGTLIMIIVLKIYLKFLEKFKVRFNFILEFLGYIAILLTMELFFLKTIPNFYQAVDLCGVFWTLFTLWQIMGLENSKKTKSKLFLIGLSYGFMVLTRPLYVFYIIPVLIAIWKYLFKDKKIQWKNALIFALPISIMAIFQMCYNYARFENIFEFGQYYQITFNDTSSLKFEPGMAINGLLSFLFNPPYISRHFPFVGYYNAGVNNGNVIFTEMIFGVFWHPFLLILLTARNRIKNNPNYSKLKIYTIVFWGISIIQFVLDVCLAGIIQRYMADVLPTLTILALAYWLIYINESKCKETKIDRIKLYKIICFVSFIIMSMFFYTRIDGRLLDMEKYKHIDKRVIDYTITHSLEFYK